MGAISCFFSGAVPDHTKALRRAFRRRDPEVLDQLIKTVRAVPPEIIETMLELLYEAGDRAIFNLPSLQRREAYERVARAYPGHHVEMDVEGNIIVMPPAGLRGGSIESELNFQVGIWNHKTKLGKVFSSQTVFRFPNGAYRMPDTAWMPINEPRSGGWGSSAEC
jgi:hypothetical protein